MMKKIVVAAVLGVLFIPSGALADERVGDAALGALSGVVVLGPIGAAAGAVIGYTAGPAIAGSWGVRRSEPRRSAKARPRTRNRVSSKQAHPPADLRRDAAAHVEATQEPPTQEAPKEVSTPPAKPSVKSDDAAAHVEATQEPPTQEAPKEISTPRAKPSVESDDAKLPINGLEM